MSDRTRKNAEQEEVQQIPASARGRPGPIHEALYGQIMEDVLKLVQEYAPTTGTVTGMEGGKVLVDVDDESEPRQVGIPREKGRRYQPGDRIRLQRTRGSGKDQYTALGQVSTKDGRDPAVGQEDLHENSVTNHQLAGNAVKKENIDGGAVGSNEVERGSLGLDHLNNNAQNTINNKADGNHKHNISDINGANFADKSHTHKADDISGLNFASSGHSHNEYAKSSHNHSISDITGLQKKLDELEAKIKKAGGGSNG